MRVQHDDVVPRWGKMVPQKYIRVAEHVVFIQRLLFILRLYCYSFAIVEPCDSGWRGNFLWHPCLARPGSFA